MVTLSTSYHFPEVILKAATCESCGIPLGLLLLQSEWPKVPRSMAIHLVYTSVTVLDRGPLLSRTGQQPSPSFPVVSLQWQQLKESHLITQGSVASNFQSLLFVIIWVLSPAQAFQSKAETTQSHPIGISLGRHQKALCLSLWEPTDFQGQVLNIFFNLNGDVTPLKTHCSSWILSFSLSKKIKVMKI